MHTVHWNQCPQINHEAFSHGQQNDQTLIVGSLWSTTWLNLFMDKRISKEWCFLSCMTLPIVTGMFGLESSGLISEVFKVKLFTHYLLSGFMLTFGIIGILHSKSKTTYSRNFEICFIIHISMLILEWI